MPLLKFLKNKYWGTKTTLNKQKIKKPRQLNLKYVLNDMQKTNKTYKQIIACGRPSLIKVNTQKNNAPKQVKRKNQIL